jgi:amino acid permease
VSFLFVSVLVLIAVITGFLGYFAFGSTTDTVILLNLPNNSWVGIAAKLFYCFTIMGSFVLLIQPIFYIMERSNWYTTILEPKQDD